MTLSQKEAYDLTDSSLPKEERNRRAEELQRAELAYRAFYESVAEGARNQTTTAKVTSSTGKTEEVEVLSVGDPEEVFHPDNLAAPAK